MNSTIGKLFMAIVLGIFIASNAYAQIKVGDKKDEGIVYWIDNTGNHGLIADVKDLGQFNFDDAIIACKNKGIGWRLPTMEELDILYKNKDIVGGFTSGKYRSSRDGLSGSSWNQKFENGFQNSSSKTNTFYVRAVRSF